MLRWLTIAVLMALAITLLALGGGWQGEAANDQLFEQEAVDVREVAALEAEAGRGSGLSTVAEHITEQIAEQIAERGLPDRPEAHSLEFVEATGARLPGAPLQGASLPNSATHAVRFIVDGPGAPDVQAVRLLTVGAGLRKDVSVQRGDTQATASVELPPGAFVAAAVDSDGYGPLVEFELADAGRDVVLPLPRPFELTFQVQDSETREPLVGATAVATRLGAPVGWPAPAEQRATADALGVVRLSHLRIGDWQLEVAHSEYETSTYTTTFPGAWSASIASTGRAEFFFYFIVCLEMFCL